MKKLILIVFLYNSYIMAQIQTPQASPRAKLEQIVGLTKVKIDYSRPATRGRSIIGDLVPFGEMWRTGANADTTIEFSDDVKVGGGSLKSGTYSIYTRPNDSSWDVFFYSKYDNSGLPKEWDPSKIAAQLRVYSRSIDPAIEHFTISIDEMTSDSAILRLAWEKTEIKIPFEVPTDSKAIASIEKTMNGEPTSRDYYQAAVYYRESRRDLQKAKSWMAKAIKMDSGKYWMHFQYALILAELDEKEEAVKSSKTSLKLSEQAGNQDYIRLVTKAIAKWSK